MGDINEYILSQKIRSFTSTLGLCELITYRNGLMSLATTSLNKIKKQSTKYVDYKEYPYPKEGTSPSTLDKI